MTSQPQPAPDRIPSALKIVALAGGVGGAKLADGLSQVLPPENLTIIVNTGDDLEHLGLYISPDLDTVCYTLGGLSNPATGWGRAGETFNTLDQVALLGGESWFRLGDKDLGTHIERTRRLAGGQHLSQVTREFCSSWKIRNLILPMSDQPVRTMVDTLEHGRLPFQEYFVHRGCEPTVRGFEFVGVRQALPAPGTLEAIARADGVVICPSNPWVSIDPILAVPGMLSALQDKVVVAVSPIVGGKTIKGPAAKMFLDLGLQPSALAVARHYGNLLRGFVLDQVDAQLAREMEIQTLVTNTLMTTSQVRRSLAKDVLNLLQSLL